MKEKRLPTPFSPFPRKRFGQHFLEPAWVQKVVRAIDPQPDETFVEIGPGRGALTRPLLGKARAVVAFEIDRDLASALAASGEPHLRVVEGDFLESRWLDTHQLESPLRVAGNLPYNVASPVLFRLAELHASGVAFADATLMVQREIADRLIAEPGTREYGVLSILIRHVADVQRVLALPAGAFRPAPKVQSALVRVRFHAPNPPVNDEATFTAIVRAIFTRRRKTLANALLAFPPAGGIGAAAVLGRAGIDGGRRPETLSVPELVRLADAFVSVSGRAVLP